MSLLSCTIKTSIGLSNAFVNCLHSSLNEHSCGVVHSVLIEAAEVSVASNTRVAFASNLCTTVSISKAQFVVLNGLSQQVDSILSLNETLRYDCKSFGKTCCQQRFETSQKPLHTRLIDAKSLISKNATNIKQIKLVQPESKKSNK